MVSKKNSKTTNVKSKKLKSLEQTISLPQEENTIIHEENGKTKLSTTVETNGGGGGVVDIDVANMDDTVAENIKNNSVVEKLKQFEANHQHEIFSDHNFRTVLVFGVVAFIVYKIFDFTMSYLTRETVYDFSNYAQTRVYYGYEWLAQPRNMNILTPFICGLIFSIFSWMIVYLDSNIPGVFPPSPFSPKSKYLYRKQKSNSIDLSYATALFTGVVVTGLMLCNC